MKKDRSFLTGHCDVVIVREAIGLGEVIVLTPLFRELKRLNPFIRTTLKTSEDRIENIIILMKEQPYPDRIVPIEENIKRDVPYYEFDLTNINFEFEQKHKPNIMKSRTRISLDALGIQGDSKPFYLLQEEDIEWVIGKHKKKTYGDNYLPRWYTFVQLEGKERYKSCDMEQLMVYCRAILNNNHLGDVVIVSSQESDSVKEVEPQIYLAKCPDIRKAITLQARSMLSMGFDSIFQQTAAALDIPFLALLGPASCQGRIADNKHASVIRSEEDCESCFRDSGPLCKISKTHDKSACLYNINPEKLAEELCELRARKTATVGSMMSYLPGDYYPEGFDPKTQKFVIDSSDISKIHQPVHNDDSYGDEWQRKRVKWICEHAITKYGVLDIGCANGYIVNSMVDPKEGYRHCGVDYDGDRIRLAKQEKKKSIAFYVIDARYGLPFPDKSFSTVVLAEVLEHLDFKIAKEMFEEAYRVSAGNVLITMPFAGDDYHENHDRIRMVESIDHLWKATPANLDSLLEGYINKRELHWFAFIEVTRR